MKYRKRPIVIEAKQITLNNVLEVAEWCNGIVGKFAMTISIPTLEGDMIAQMEDWIIKGTRGEFYPCKPNVFADVYEQVEE